MRMAPGAGERVNIMAVRRAQEGLDRQRLRLRNHRRKSLCTALFRQEYSRERDNRTCGAFNYNWGYYLMCLKTLCETGMGVPFGRSNVALTPGATVDHTPASLYAHTAVATP